MVCSECGGFTKVTDSRDTPLQLKRRRRECGKCGFRFTTYEFSASKMQTFIDEAIENATQKMAWDADSFLKHKMKYEYLLAKQEEVERWNCYRASSVVPKGV